MSQNSHSRTSSLDGSNRSRPLDPHHISPNSIARSQYSSALSDRPIHRRGHSIPTERMPFLNVPHYSMPQQVPPLTISHNRSASMPDRHSIIQSTTKSQSFLNPNVPTYFVTVPSHLAPKLTDMLPVDSSKTQPRVIKTSVSTKFLQSSGKPIMSLSNDNHDIVLQNGVFHHMNNINQNNEILMKSGGEGQYKYTMCVTGNISKFLDH